MANGGSFEPAPGIFNVEVKISPTPGLLNNHTGLRVEHGGSTTLPPGAAPTSCASPSGRFYTPFSSSACGAPASNWYAVLVFANGTIGSVFDSSGVWSGAPTMLTDLMEIYTVSGGKLSSAADSLVVYGVDIEEFQSTSVPL
jgi:hypothetical protein